MRDSVLLDAAEAVIRRPAPAQFSLVAHFLSTAPGSTFSFYPVLIEGMAISRNYADNFADEIDLQMTISPKDYALMQDQGQDLRCVITLTYLNRYGSEIYTPAPIQRQYVAMLNDPRDIRKAIPDVQHYTQPSVPTTVRLVEETVYNLRHTKLSGIYQTLTVEQAIYAVTQNFGIGKIHLVPPDNTHVYDHIELGSYQGISSIYGYLQSSCGVYEKGINAYITDDVLYVYPPFETNPTYDRSVMFYQVDTGRFAGSPAFHRVEESKVSIVVNTQPQSMDLSILGAENVGTGFIFNRASHLNDGVTAPRSQGGAQFTEQPALRVELNESRTATGSRNNLRHIHGTDNPYPMMSELMAHQASLMELEWPNANPFLLDPCHQVSYYYDHDEAMVKKTGILEKASYLLERQQRSGAKSLFTCKGSLSLRLSPNISKVI